MPERTLVGFAAAPGVDAGPALRFDAPAPTQQARPGDLRRARVALEETARELERLAASLPSDEAAMVEASALMAADPTLAAAVERLVSNQGRPAALALLAAGEEIAAQLGALDDPLLAERADDVRSVTRRAARRLTGESRRRRGGGVLVATGLGPADVAELGADVRALALVAGGVTAHAAIVARSLGLPMVVGLGEALLAVREGETLVVDGTRGEVVLAPSPARIAAAEQQRRERQRRRRRAIAARQRPAQTRDGHGVRVLANASSPAEVAEALEQGAEGIGLLRTELLFLDSRQWPDEERHRRFLEPILAPLAGRSVTIRLLDFGGDKTPPFLRGASGRGIELLLEAPAALRAQLAAIVATACHVELRVLVPMVTRPGQVETVRAALAEVSGGQARARLGVMIETPEAALRADELARRVDFLSLGTNDLTQLTLGLDRETSGASPVTHPEVLGLVAAAIRAANAAGIPAEVCGEAASDAAVIPLLVGLGAAELSVGAARVGEVRELLRRLDYRACQGLAEAALLGQALDTAGQRG